MMVSKSDSDRVADHWNQEGAWVPGRGVYWQELPAVQNRLNQKISEDPSINWLRYTLERYFYVRLPLGRCLSLGCGEGSLERSLASLGAFLACDACDIAAGSIEKARSAAQAKGYSHINYSVSDLNIADLPKQYYDAVWAQGAVHHIERLEWLFQQVAGSLKPGGIFILNEYIGASRFQFAPRQRQVIQACHDLLPSRYLRLTQAAVKHAQSLDERHGAGWWLSRIVGKLRDGDLLPAVQRRLRRRRWLSGQEGALLKSSVNLPTLSSVVAVDPSESIRSAEIIPILKEHFDLIEFKPLGGSILQFLLADIAGNFQDEAGTDLLEMLFGIEDALMACGDLASDFAYIVAAPRHSLST